MDRDLLCWYDRNRRRLPWRLAKPDPYKTWISEIMLQQTQVEMVLPYYEKFLKNFPTVFDLAAAPLEKVLTLWSGLGYYSRARNLHAAAMQIVYKKRGKKRGTFPAAMQGKKVHFPSTMEEWLELPGVGTYTAGAIASIAFEEKVPVVDGNVIRVLARLFALKGDPKKNPLRRKLWELVAKLLPEKRIGDFNQALMELGALVCTPENPKCGVCPLRKNCRALSLNKVADFPIPKPKAQITKVSIEVALIEKKGKYLIAKRNGDRHFQEMWEFPQTAPERLGLCADKRRSYSKIRHSIMNRRLQLTPVLYRYVRGSSKKSKQYVDYQWIKLNHLDRLPTSSLNFKIAKNILSARIRRPAES